MSATVSTKTAGPLAPTPGAAVSWRRIWTVARLDLLQRRRTSRWPIVLGLWALVILAVTWLTDRTFAGSRAAMESAGAPAEVTSGIGWVIVDVVTFFVLLLTLLVIPSVTATSINGDREAGVLATLQTTMATAWDIVLGKLLAAWIVSAVFLATALPFLAWAWVRGGVGLGLVARTLATLLVVAGVVAALGLMFSSLTARTVASATLSYLAIAALTVGTVITFLLSLTLVTDHKSVTVRGVDPSWWNDHAQPPAGADLSTWNPPQPTPKDCTTFTESRDVIHTERTWWLLAVNPFVVVADVGAVSHGPESAGVGSPMWEISRSVREARAGATPPGGLDDRCASETSYGDGSYVPPDLTLPAGPVWPWGLGALALVGIGAVAVAARRIHTPIHRLPSGTRIA